MGIHYLDPEAITSHQYRSNEHNGPCTYCWYIAPHATPCGKPRDVHVEVDYLTARRDKEQSNETD